MSPRKEFKKLVHLIRTCYTQKLYYRDQLAWDILDQLRGDLHPDSRLDRDVLERCISQRDVGAYLELGADVHPQKYADGEETIYLLDRQFTEIFSKYPWQTSPHNVRAAAERKFWEAEARCRETNERFRRLHAAPGSMIALLSRAARVVDRVLGTVDLNQVAKNCRFGPGATLCVTGRRTTPYFKYECRLPTVTSSAFPYAEALLHVDSRWHLHLLGMQPSSWAGSFCPLVGVDFVVTNYNKLAFVPKNAKTDRSIAIEPYFNVYFQLGFGAVMRQRLKRHGIDLDDQTRNQRAAREGSMKGNVATIDFSMASDTVSCSLVRELLPDAWHQHLSALRCPTTKVAGRYYVLEKFSSMGNGFTFELETLLFYALAVACCEALDVDTHEISVYGDDVIIPTAAVALFTEFAAFCGLVVNAEKSFATGAFRESCGADYLFGKSVRPVYCKRLDTVQDVVSLRNRLVHLYGDNCGDSDTGSFVGGALRACDKAIPALIRQHLVGPISSEIFDGWYFTTSTDRVQQSGLSWYDYTTWSWRLPRVRFSPRRFVSKGRAGELIMYGSIKGSVREDLPPSAFRYNLDAPAPLVVTARETGRHVLDHYTAFTLS